MDLIRHHKRQVGIRRNNKKKKRGSFRGGGVKKDGPGFWGRPVGSNCPGGEGRGIKKKMGVLAGQGGKRVVRRRKTLTRKRWGEKTTRNVGSCQKTWGKRE